MVSEEHGPPVWTLSLLPMWIHSTQLWMLSPPGQPRNSRLLEGSSPGFPLAKLGPVPEGGWPLLCLAWLTGGLSFS